MELRHTLDSDNYYGVKAMPVDLTKYNKPETSCSIGEMKLEQGRGFLPGNDPVLDIDHGGFRELTALSRQIPKLLAENRLVDTLDQMPQLPKLPNNCSNMSLLERAYSIAVSIVHAYIIEKGGDRDTNKNPVLVPKKLSIWLKEASDLIGRYPTQTYETYILQNYERINAEAGYVLENLRPLVTYTDTSGEAWFIIMHVVSEHLGGHVLMHYAKLANLSELSFEDRNAVLLDTLTQMNTALVKLVSHLNNMRHGISGWDFFFKLRPYLKSWEPGVIMDGVQTYNNSAIQWRGASGAQSSIVPALDRMFEFNVSQLQTMRDMVNYMPPQHQLFLSRLDNSPASVRDMVRVSRNATVIGAYNSLVESTVAFRQTHYQFIIDTYIVKNLVEIFGNSTITAIESSNSNKPIVLPVQFAWDLLHQLFTITKANIVHRELGYLLNQDSSGKLDGILGSIQLDLKTMLRTNCLPLGIDDTTSNFSVALSKLYCDTILALLSKYNLEHLLAEEHTGTLNNILDVIHANHTVLLSKALGTGGTDFTYFLQKNIEQNKAAALPLPTEELITLPAPSIQSYLRLGSPSLFVGMASGFSDSFVTKVWGREHGEKASAMVSVVTMSASGYSSQSIATFIGLQFALQGLGLPKKYASYLSWALMLFSLITDLNPQAMLINMLIGVAANFCGDKIGRSIGEVSSNTATLFFKVHNGASVKKEARAVMRPHKD
ncbi:MAG: hypothetical protein K0S29_1154 [Gammaproteobacteria bacterium]|jgi:indoleamine 2,3-dioxygenase|nr:hypothetical protein [Gammaproteobacteria bacterium]